jgi:hypothetical protein
MKKFKEVYNELKTLSNLLKKKGFKGVDVSIDESLYFYRFVCKETEDGEIEVIISVNNAAYELIDEYFDDDFEIGEDLIPKFYITYYDYDDIFDDEEVKDFDSSLEDVFIKKILDEKINIHESYYDKFDFNTTNEVIKIIKGE